MSVCKTVICCGSGGVGKTTTSAALAIRAARSGKKTVVLTIDPARRLAGALGVSLGNAPRSVPGIPNLDALMLDPKQTFDEIVTRLAPNREARSRILGNHYYHYVSEHLAGVHEYMAMERLLELTLSGEYEVVVLDTPPARHALDFMAAPDRMARLMDEGVMRWLTLPASQGGWRMIERGSEVLARVLEKMLGEGTIADIAEFFSAFQSLWEGFRERSIQVAALLRSPNTRFVLVTTPSPAARADALDFLKMLKSQQMPFAGFILNRCVEAPVKGPYQWPPAPDGVDGGRWARLQHELTLLPEQQFNAYVAQEEAIGGLVSGAPAGSRVWRLPELSPLETLGMQAAEHELTQELTRLETLAGLLPDMLWA